MLNNKYLFLISSERSGSNLITRIINSNSKICGPSPCHLIRLIYENIGSYGDLIKEKNWNTLVKDIFDLWKSKLGDWNIEIKLDELLEFTPKSHGDLIKYIYDKEICFSKKSIGFIKEISTYKFIDQLELDYQSPRYIHLVRDPRDMALSWSNSPIHRGDILRASKIWNTDQENTLKKSKELKDRYYILKYEELIKDPKKELNLLCDFIEVKFENMMIDFFQERSNKDQALKTDNWRNLSKSIMDNNSMKFKTNLVADQIKLIEYENYILMKEYDYNLEYNLINEDEYCHIKNNLEKLERYEKEEYKTISEKEKIARNKWESVRRLIETKNKE